MSEKIKGYCSICGQFKNLRIPSVGISFGMSGYDYCFCYKCLKEINSDQFFRKIAKINNLKYPLKHKK